MRSLVFCIALSTSILVGTCVVNGQARGRTHVDKANHFSFDYPSDFRVDLRKAAAADTYFGDPGVGTKLLRVRPISIPLKYHGGYEFNIWRTNDSKDCGEIKEGEDHVVVFQVPEEGPRTRTIDGQNFFAYTGTEAGMSKYLRVDGYRGVVGGKCWSIQSVSYQSSGYDDSKGFDKKIIERAFEKFIASFRFK